MLTNLLCLFYRYVDFTSLYPWCNKNTRNVVGLCKTCVDTLNKNPCTHTEQERAIRGTWCHVKLMKAIEKGYEVLNIHEVWHWEETTDTLFKGYVDTFLKTKQEASGYPKDCVTDEQKQRYVEGYERHEGIQLNPEKIEYNPGLRYLAKLVLNSLWGMYMFHNVVSSVGTVVIPRSPVQFRNEGFIHFILFLGKFAQRSNLTKTELVTEPKVFFDYLDSTKYEVSDARMVNDDTVEVHYTNTEEFAEQDNKTNIVIAAFTTAYARLKLYDLLDLLQERVLYYDTDSVIYVHEPGKPDPPLGDYLGDLTDELDAGDYITTFISGGPKNYAYLTSNGKTETKIRGITLNYDATKTINMDVMRHLIDSYVNGHTEEKVTVENPHKITRDKKEKNIVTKKMKKDYRIVYNKRVITENYGTLPYGY